MPYIKYKEDSRFNLFLWKIDESLSDLKSMLKNKQSVECNQFRSLIHQKQCIAKYLIFNKLGILDLVKKDIYGKPYLVDNRYISISHSGEYVAVVLSNQQVGLDLELNRPKLKYIQNKFLSTTEKIEENQLVWYWTAKESIYKLYGKKGLDFIEDIKIEKIDFENYKGEALLKKRIKIELIFMNNGSGYTFCISFYKKYKA